MVKNISTGEALLLKKLDPISQREYVLSKQAADYLQTSPGAWFSLTLDSAFMGKGQAVLGNTIRHCAMPSLSHSDFPDDLHCGFWPSATALRQSY
ncbi:MAG: hypothetical protein IPK63_10785 [Candidatus Competibacteraceae bacterium]|nr:hypothetical protein [Candidatus Competibacteraceae bacterium]